MFVRTSRTFGLLLLSILALGALADSPLSAFRSRDLRAVVFTASLQTATQVRAADPTVVRSRLVTIDVSALQTARPTDPTAIAPPSLLLNLFDDLAYNVVIDRVDPADGGFTLVGHIPGYALSTVTLSSIGDIVAGSIVMPEAVYSIRYVGNGVHEVAQVDQSKFLSELNPVAAPLGQAGIAPAAATDSPALMGDSASTIDVLVLYTPAAAAAAGGSTAMATRVNLGISEANTSYLNSGITQRLRLANSQQVAYTENNDLAQDLYAVGNYDYNIGTISTPLGNAAASLRNTYGADLVMLLTSPVKPNGCGIAWFMNVVSSSMAKYAFSVVEQSCVSPNYSFAHELGHNMGAAHDWYMDNGVTPYTYAHGYIDAPNRFRTVMSYNNACFDQGFNCTRLLYWSNPGVVSPSANGSAPMGIPGGTKSDCPTGVASNISCDADDHLTLNNTAFTVANFRQALGAPAAPLITTQPSNQSALAGSTASFTAAASGNPAPTVQWQVSTNGGLNFSFISGATSGTYAFTAALADSGKQYHAVFSNASGTATTIAVMLTVQTLPSITTNPVDVTAAAGGSVSFSAAASGSPTPTVQWQVSTDGGATFTNVSGATATTYTFTAAAGNHNNRYRAVFTNPAGSAQSNLAVLTVTGQITVDPSPLRFAATKAGAGSAIVFATPAQTVSVSGISTAWTATAGQTWLQVTGGSGTGAGQFSVSLVNSPDVVGGSTSLSGTITVSTTASAASIPVMLTVYRPGTTGAPIGAFDTPADGTTGMQGSFAVTGWALDDVAIDRVEIWRDPVAGETTPVWHNPYGSGAADPREGKIFIANPLFIANARPDVEGLYSAYPMANRAGWGYLLLSWGLWGQGNGTYKLYAFAFDVEGNATTLGTKTVTVDNAHANKPFGAIDTPGYGQTVSGTDFVNFGWALTPPAPSSCRINNGGVLVGIDSGPLAAVTYGDARPDIAGGFPGFLNSANASGAFYVDTTALSNGVHQIGWLVTDSCGRQDGIGSRFFNVRNAGADAGALGLEAGLPVSAPSATVGSRQITTSDVGKATRQPPTVGDPRAGVPLGSPGSSPATLRSARDTTTSLVSGAITVRQLGGAWEAVEPNADGTHVIEMAQNGRIEVQLPRVGGGRYLGGHLVDGERRALPLGSSLDAAAGIFYWQPAAGFLGKFDLVFGSSAGQGTAGGGVARVRVVVGPSMRAMIDTPGSGDVVDQTFTLAGWALDLAATAGTGVDTVHVWAYPVTGSNTDPIFLGVATYGDERPDVGKMFGETFSGAAYGLTVDGLAPGTYDVVMFPHRAKTNTFEGARVARVTVR